MENNIFATHNSLWSQYSKVEIVPTYEWEVIFTLEVEKNIPSSITLEASLQDELADEDYAEFQETLWADWNYANKKLTMNADFDTDVVEYYESL